MVPRLKSTRRKRVGIQMADAIVEMVHLMYQTQTAKALLEAMIDRVRERIKEFEI
jgi:hypothetical protein